MKTYSAWNEVNHKSQPTFKSPRKAAGYYNVLRTHTRKGKFRAMAADMLDTGNMSRYLARVQALRQGQRRSCGACTTTATSTAAARRFTKRCCAPSPARSG